MSAISGFASITVLIAHDDPLIAAGLVAVLREQIDFVAVVCNPKQAVSFDSSSHFPPNRIVIADYDSGLRLLTGEYAESHRVVILTHNDREASISYALKQGACGYVLLGGSLQELIEGLRLVHAGGQAVGGRVAGRIVDWMQQQALTGREAEVLRLMMLGLSNKAIANKLTLTVGTVKTYAKSILHKLRATSRTEAVSIAHRRGILREERGSVAPDVDPPSPITKDGSAGSARREYRGDSFQLTAANRNGTVRSRFGQQ